MDKDRIVGSGKQIKGGVEQVVGKAVGDAKLESEGNADQIEGKVQNTIGFSVPPSPFDRCSSLHAPPRQRA